MPRPQPSSFLVYILVLLVATPLYSTDFEQDIQPILKKYCYRCHNSSSDVSELDLEKLDPNVASGQDTGFWHEALNQLNETRMPPEEAKALSDEELITLTSWLETEIQKARELRTRKGGDQSMRRMTRYEFQYTLEDLLGISLDYREHVPPDLTDDDGLKTNRSLLGISPALMEAYLKVADMALKEAIPDTVEPTHREKQTTLQITTIRGQRKRTNKTHSKVPLPEGVKAKPSVIAPTFGIKQTAFDHDLPRKVTFEKRPFAGRFAISIEVNAKEASDGRLPELTVLVGHRASGDYTPKKVLGQQMLQHSTDAQTIRFVGNIEDFPLGNKDGYYNGSGSHDITHLSVWIWNTATPTQKYKMGTAIQDIDEPLLDVKSVELEGPLLGGFPSDTARELLPMLDDDDSEIDAAMEALARFLTRAFRRTANANEVDKYLDYFKRFRSITGDYRSAMRNTFSMALLSPEFIFLLESSSDDSTPRELSSHELATRLSYFLWASMPDSDLLALADSSDLLQSEVLRAQVQRMSADPRFKRFTEHFTTQWLGLEAMRHVAVNSERFPAFNEKLRNDLLRETVLFSEHIFTHDLSLINFIRSDFAVLNRTLANHYDIENVDGEHFRRVELTDGIRPGGVLPQGTVSLIGSDGTESNPIYRGVWLKKRLFADPPPPPPPGAPPLDDTEAKHLTLKQQIELHRKATACARCHNQIDPWGIAFEEFNVLGQVKLLANPTSQEVKFDASTKLPDGTQIVGLQALQDHLTLARSREFANALVRRVAEYALGRPLDFSDEEFINKMSNNLIDNGFRPSSLLEDIVTSQAFRSK